MAQVHIHEDDAGLCQLFPAAIAQAVLADLAAARAHAEAPDTQDSGWEEMHQIALPKAPFDLSAAEMAEILAPRLPRISSFRIGYGRDNPFHRHETEALCYGFGPTAYIKLETDGPAVRALWYAAGSPEAAHQAALRQAFEALDARTPLVLADYWRLTGGLVADSAFLDRYFAPDPPSPPPASTGSWPR